jgi:hypothetical protein
MVRFIALFFRARWIARGGRHLLAYLVGMARGAPKSLVARLLHLWDLLLQAECESCCSG